MWHYYYEEVDDRTAYWDHYYINLSSVIQENEFKYRDDPFRIIEGLDVHRIDNKNIEEIKKHPVTKKWANEIIAKIIANMMTKPKIEEQFFNAG